MTVVFDQLSTSVPTVLYRCQQVRELDRLATAEAKIPSQVLMARAGRAAFGGLLQRWPNVASITVLCGGGNNGGDGYVVAALAAQQRIPVRVLWLVAPEKLTGAAQLAYHYALQENVPVASFEADALADPAFASGVVVDALLGTGLTGEVRQPFADAIHSINRSGLPVLAIDIPSGLDGDTGAVLGIATEATLTATFIGLKQGLFTGRGPALVGDLLFAQLDVPQPVYQGLRPAAHLCQLHELVEAVPVRQADAHKGQFGHVMVIGGDRGLGGATMMAAEMAARAGAGLVGVATRAEHVSAILSRLPEAMAAAVASGQELEPYLKRPTVLVVGPGLGRSPWSEQMLQQAAKRELPLVLDADALNLLAEGRVLPQPRRDDWILTPHPGEAARLLGVTTAQVQADRFAAADQLQRRYGGVVVLKGAGTVIADGQNLWVANCGNAGMAVGGMGDILSGLVGALLAQGLEAGVAARLAVSLHGAAGDLAAEASGQRGLLPTDLMPYVRELLNP